MSFEERLPKVDLHRHLIGCVRQETFGELARRTGAVLPMSAKEVYSRVNSSPTPEQEARGPWFPLLTVYRWICDCLVTEGDFERIAYESLEDGLNYANIRYQELAFSPSVHMKRGVDYRTVARGLIRGIRTAEEKLGVRAKLIAAVDREDSVDAALAMVREVIDFPTPEVVAIGLDFFEGTNPPEKFVPAFREARAAGLRATAHAGEHKPPRPENISICLDQLGCSRIDHGYYILLDEKIVDRCRRDGIVFNVVFSTTRQSLEERSRVIRDMYHSGLTLTVNTDDPRLFDTTLSREMRIARNALDIDAAGLKRFSANSVEAAFLDESDKIWLKEQLQL